MQAKFGVTDDLIIRCISGDPDRDLKLSRCVDHEGHTPKLGVVGLRGLEDHALEYRTVNHLISSIGTGCTTDVARPAAIAPAIGRGVACLAALAALTFATPTHAAIPTPAPALDGICTATKPVTVDVLTLVGSALIASVECHASAPAAHPRVFGTSLIRPRNPTGER